MKFLQIQLHQLASRQERGNTKTRDTSNSKPDSSVDVAADEDDDDAYHSQVTLPLPKMNSDAKSAKGDVDNGSNTWKVKC